MLQFGTSPALVGFLGFHTISTHQSVTTYTSSLVILDDFIFTRFFFFFSLSLELAKILRLSTIHKMRILTWIACFCSWNFDLIYF